MENVASHAGLAKCQCAKMPRLRALFGVGHEIFACRRSNRVRFVRNCFFGSLDSGFSYPCRFSRRLHFGYRAQLSYAADSFRRHLFCGYLGACGMHSVFRVSICNVEDSTAGTRCGSDTLAGCCDYRRHHVLVLAAVPLIVLARHCARRQPEFD